MNTWSGRIKSRMRELGITQEALAAKMGITRGAITHYLAGRRQPPLHQFQKLANLLKADPAWLQFGTSIASSVPVAKKAKEPLNFPLPILTWQQIASFKNPTKIKKEDISEYVPHFFTDQSHWYALKVQGDAMTATTGHSKSFLASDLIIIDSEATVKNGDFVVAILPRAKEATFKQYVVDGGLQYLKPLNPQYPIITINEGTHICGVMVRCLI